MKTISRYFFGVTLSLAAAVAMASTSTLKQEVVRYDNVQIEVNSQGEGPVIVMLPSLGRSGRDYDQVANYLQADGFRVVRPEPRGIGQSKGPMDNLSVDDYFAAGSAPILDLQGESDTVAPRRFSGVLKSMLGDRVQVVVLKNAGHAMAPEQPKAMADAISAFAKAQYAK